MTVRTTWLAGDHHVHTQYSADGKYRVADQVRMGREHGLRWLVITDHGGAAHARFGVEEVAPDIHEARDRYPDMLVFQGLEWNVPGAEHGTVFVHPGERATDALRAFERGFDGAVRKALDSTPENEALAVAGLHRLAEEVADGRVADALMLANHPARRGFDSPHQLRDWRDAAPSIAVGMEGAPGHQAATLPNPPQLSGLKNRLRGLYDFEPSEGSHPGYPKESYRTWGGFDWMTATVGGVWDSLLAEGRPWWITANSDSHHVIGDFTALPDWSTKERFHETGRHGDAEPGDPVSQHDHWPGQYGRTMVGAAAETYQGVMDGLRAGRVWVDHGRLIGGLDVRVTADGGDAGGTLGSAVRVRRGACVRLEVTVHPQRTPNAAGFVPRPARVDVVRGAVAGPSAERDALRAPGTAVARSFEPAGDGPWRFTHDLGSVDAPCYLRLRGTDGNRGETGFFGAATDPHGPAADLSDELDTWRDLWFYSNPVFVLPED